MKKTIIAIACVLGLGSAIAIAQNPAPQENNGANCCAETPCVNAPCQNGPSVPPPCDGTPERCVLPDSPCVCSNAASDSCKACPDCGKCCQKGKAKHGKHAKKGKRSKRYNGKGGQGVQANPGESRAFAGIELTPQQQIQLKEIADDRQEQYMDIKDEFNKSRSKADAKFEKQLQKILTPEQYAKYLSNKGKVRRGNGNVTFRGAKGPCRVNKNALIPGQQGTSPQVPGPKPTLMTGSK